MGWLSWIPTKGGGQLTSSVLVSPSLPFCIKNMSQPTASRSAISAVHQWLERMEEENQIWDRKIAEEAFDASQFLRDCISYRKRSSKHIAVKKRLWWCCKFSHWAIPRSSHSWFEFVWWQYDERLSTVDLWFFGVLFDWVVATSQGDFHARRCSSVVERRLALEVRKFRYWVFSLGPRFNVCIHSEPYLHILPSHTVALMVNQHHFLLLS